MTLLPVNFGVSQVSNFFPVASSKKSYTLFRHLFPPTRTNSHTIKVLIM